MIDRDARVITMLSSSCMFERAGGIGVFWVRSSMLSTCAGVVVVRGCVYTRILSGRSV